MRTAGRWFVTHGILRQVIIKGNLLYFPTLFTLSFLFILIVFGNLLFSFFLYNPLNSVDIAGLYFSTWYQSEYLFPHVIGWNPYFFMGYPQNQFYPPLFAYLGAALGQIVPLPIAFKILFGFSVLLLPLSFYIFSRSFGFSRERAAVAMSAMTALLFLFPGEFYGGNIHATFNIGLVTHSLGMALFFIYWSLLEKKCDSNRVILPSLLLSLIILTHIVAAFAAVFVLLGYIGLRIRDRTTWKFFLLHGLLVFLLTAFWTLPFLLKSSWLNAYPIGIVAQPFLFVVVTVVYLLILTLQRRERYYPVAFFFVILLSFSFIASSFLFIPVHLYRFMMFLLVLLPFMFLSLLRRLKWQLSTLILLLSIFFILTSSPIHPEGPQPIQLETIHFSSADGRVFVMAPLSKESSPHLLQHQIPLQNRLYGLRGLYIESSKNSRFISDLEHEIEPLDSAVWGLYVDSTLIPKNRTYVLESLLPLQLNFLGVSAVVAPENYSSSWKRQYDLGTYTPYANVTLTTNYSFYLVMNSSYFEVLTYQPRVVNESWDDRLAPWFMTNDFEQGILVRESVPNDTGIGTERIDVLEMSPRQDYIRLNVSAAHVVPLLIKISQFPNWKAYQNGMPLHIYTASPYFMLVYGSGIIELRYEPLWIDRVSDILSILGLMLFVYVWIVSRHEGRQSV